MTQKVLFIWAMKKVQLNIFIYGVFNISIKHIYPSNNHNYNTNENIYMTTYWWSIFQRIRTKWMVTIGKLKNQLAALNCHLQVASCESSNNGSMRVLTNSLIFSLIARLTNDRKRNLFARLQSGNYAMMARPWSGMLLVTCATLPITAVETIGSIYLPHECQFVWDLPHCRFVCAPICVCCYVC